MVLYFIMKTVCKVSHTDFFFWKPKQEECEGFSSALLTLRLLARFLGFILHLPYQGASNLPQHLLQDNMDLRNKVSAVLFYVIGLSHARSLDLNVLSTTEGPLKPKVGTNLFASV